MQTTLFVDIDSTLVENRFSFRVLSDVLGEIADATGKEIGELGREMGAENARRQAEDPDHPLTMDWDDIVETLAARYDVRLSRRVIDLWQAYAHADEVELLDDSPRVMAALRNGQRRLVIATKGLSKYQLPVLQVGGLIELFDEILAPDLTGYLKTSPAYFGDYLSTPGRYIHIGDHYYDDVMCARRNGFYSVLRAPIEEPAAFSPFERPAHLDAYTERISTYPASGTDLRPHALVLSLAELPEVIAEIESWPA